MFETFLSLCLNSLKLERARCSNAYLDACITILHKFAGTTCKRLKDFERRKLCCVTSNKKNFANSESARLQNEAFYQLK